MPGQVIGTVNVQVGTQNPRVSTIAYGGSKTLKSATDLDTSNLVDGDVIVYKASTNGFIVEPISSVNISLDNGFF